MPKKEPEHIDKVFKQKLENYGAAPPLDVWEQLQPVVVAKSPSWSSRNGLSLLLLITYFSLVIALILPKDRLIDQDIEDNEYLLTSTLSENFDADQNTYFNTTVSPVPAVSENLVSDNEPTDIQTKNISVSAQSIVTSQKKSDAILQGSYIEDTEESIFIEQNTFKNEENITDYSRSALDIARLPLISKNFPFDQILADFSSNENSPSYIKTTKPKYPAFSEWSIGINAGQEISPQHKSTYFPLQLNSYGVDLRYSSQFWTFKTGIKLLSGNQEVSDQLHYQTLDSVGFYNDVLSVNYIQQYDPIQETFVWVPIYVTQEVTLFDSVQHQKNIGINHNLVYLDVPLSIGYKINYRRFDFIIQGGGGVRILLNDNSTEVNFPDDAFLIDYSSDYIKARKTNYYLSLNPEIVYNVPRSRWSLYVSPRLNFYQKKPVVFQSNAGDKFNLVRALEGGIYFRIK